MQVYIFATPFSSRRIVSKATFKWICNVWHLSGVEEMLMNNILKCKEYAEHELYETILIELLWSLFQSNIYLSNFLGI